jgi:hypothetical protein
VKVGISPFGIGRPDRRPPGVTGFSQYDSLYADVELWLEKGWLDYLSPQLYWTRANPKRPFAVLLDSWMRANPEGRHMWPGLYTSELPRDEVKAQAAITTEGEVHFSMKALMNGPAFYDSPAVVPATPWLKAPPTEPPVLDVSGGRVTVTAHDATLYPVWTRSNGHWHFATVPAASGTLVVDPTVDAVVASAIDRVGNESARVRWYRAR